MERKGRSKVFGSFEDVLRLENPRQRDLLRCGDEVERVWAAWALGLRLGTQAVPELRDSLRQCPFPGTRRHLLVVLAGFGERSTLCGVASGDADPYVRTTACRYLARIAQNDDAVRRVLLERLFKDPSPDVRLAILEEGGGILASLGPDERARIMADPDESVRNRARLLLQPGPSRRSPVSRVS